VYGDNQPAAVGNGVAEFGERDLAVGDQPSVQFNPGDELMGDCPTIVVGVDEGNDDGE
jgi:hypothetical protein